MEHIAQNNCTIFSKLLAFKAITPSVYVPNFIFGKEMIESDVLVIDSNKFMIKFTQKMPPVRVGLLDPIILYVGQHSKKVVLSDDLFVDTDNEPLTYSSSGCIYESSLQLGSGVKSENDTNWLILLVESQEPGNCQIQLVATNSVGYTNELLVWVNVHA